MTKGKRTPVQGIILEILVGAGTLALAGLAPHVLAKLKKLDPAYIRRKNVRRRINETLWRMERNGLVSLPQKGTMGRVTLLPKGQALVDQIRARNYVIPKPMLWDGKWRMVMFDVPEARKNVRNQLRLLLQSAGLLRLHDSVWVHPYPCDELVMLIKAHLKNTKGEVHYLVGNLVESDQYLRDKFQL